MNESTLKRTLALSFALFLVACGADGLTLRGERSTAKVNELSHFTTGDVGSCNCLLDYNPVCGDDGRTYDNSCIANCYGITHSFGSCQEVACSSLTNYVCGQPAMPVCNNPTTGCPSVMPDPKTFLNLCVMVRENAQLIKGGTCY